MAQIDIVFGEIGEARRGTYVAEKIRAMFAAATAQAAAGRRNRLTPAKLRTYARGIESALRAGTAGNVPLARGYDLGRLSPAERRLVRRGMRCLVETVNARFPLLDGEHLEPEADRASYLARDWGGYPRRTVVLRRRSNLATTYYVVPDTAVDVRRRRVVIRPAAPRRLPRAAPAAAGPDYATAARELAKALCGLAPPPLNMIGAFAINAFWPSGGKAAADWATVYAELQKVVRNGLAADKVESAAGKVKGFASFLANEYVELKKSKRKRPGRLLQALAPYDVAFFLEVTNVFMFAEKPTADIAAASLANFMLGANLHIALNQERALVDPDYADDPGASPYARTAANLARSYADYARNAAPGVQAARLKQITAILEDHVTSCSWGQAARCTTTWFFWFEDANPRPKYRSATYSYNDADKQHPDVRAQAAKARKTYVAAVVKALNLQAQVYAVAEYWDRIGKDPIALRYAPPKSAPGLDPKGWAGRTPVAGSRRWRDGYRVRYAVSYYDARGETAKGPWWAPAGADKDGYLAGAPNALPRLTGLPVDPFWHAEGRRLYRQFDGFAEEALATIPDNRTTEYVDKAR